MCAESNIKFLFLNFSVLGNEHKDCLFCELDLEKDKIFLSESLNLSHLKPYKLCKLQNAIVEFPLKKNKSFEEVLNDCPNIHLNQPGCSFLESFVFCFYFV